MKLWDLIGGASGRSSSVELLAHGAAIVSEVALAVLIALPRTRTLGLLSCVGVFLGMGAATAWGLLGAGVQSSCGCLGPIDVGRGHALILQGLVLMGAGALLPASEAALGGRRHRSASGLAGSS